MKITKIEIQEEVWNANLRKDEKRITEYDRDSYSGDFDELILENTPRYDVINYAEENYNMINANDADCDCSPSRSPEDFDDEDLISALEERGYKIIECQTIADSLKVAEILESHLPSNVYRLTS